MLKVQVIPQDSFLTDFLKLRGIYLVDEKPNVLHFIGTERNELVRLSKQDHPDLLINHSIPDFIPGRMPYVYLPIRSERDLFQIRSAKTNCESLCRHYLRRIGIQADIQVIPKKGLQDGQEVNFLRIIERIIKLWTGVKTFMYWA